MLEPIFFSRIEQKVDAKSKTYCDFADKPLPKGITYRIRGYSRAGIYTLVTWESGDDEEKITGETLWRGKTPVATSGGIIDIYEEPPEGRVVQSELSVWARINPNLGRYGIPNEVAIELRNPSRYVPFNY